VEKKKEGKKKKTAVGAASAPFPPVPCTSLPLFPSVPSTTL
jgi:hypothetical protein